MPEERQPEERRAGGEFAWSRGENSGLWKPGDAVEVDPTSANVPALAAGETPCPEGPRRGIVERVLDADENVAVLWDDGERGEIHAHCLRRAHGPSS